MSAMLDTLRENRAVLKARLDAVIEAPTKHKRDLSPNEDAQFQALVDQIKGIDERIDEVRIQEAAAGAAAETRRLVGVVEGNAGGSGWSVTGEPDIYRDPAKDPTGPSFFRDMHRARSGDLKAAQRLQRSQEGKATLEQRAIGNTGGAGGSGGEFAPPDWLVDQFIALARPGRVFADLAQHDAVPPNRSSINIPRVATGTTTAVQSTQNTALSQTDLTTNSVSATIVTIGGKEVVSQQLIDQSGVPIDRVVLGDLAADYARQMGSQYISGLGTSGQLRGVLNAAGAANTTYTTATPKFVDGTTPANSFLNKVIAAKVAVATTRYLPATAIVMHPRRWGWIQESLDANGRPMITPTDVPDSQSQPGDDRFVVAQGAVGTLASLPVYLDPGVPTNLGAGTNQDPVFVIRREDLFLWESDIQMETFTQPYADSLGVLFRCYAYSAAIPDRFGASVNIINGTGLVAPTL